MKKIFRDEALKKSQFPDQIEEVLEVVSIKSWLLLLAIIFLIIISVIWSIFGVIYKEVKGSGILIYKDSSILEINTISAGTLKKIHVKNGDIRHC